MWASRAARSRASRRRNRTVPARNEHGIAGPTLCAAASMLQRSMNMWGTPGSVKPAVYGLLTQVAYPRLRSPNGVHQAKARAANGPRRSGSGCRTIRARRDRRRRGAGGSGHARGADPSRPAGRHVPHRVDRGDGEHGWGRRARCHAGGGARPTGRHRGAGGDVRRSRVRILALGPIAGANLGVRLERAIVADRRRPATRFQRPSRPPARGGGPGLGGCLFAPCRHEQGRDGRKDRSEPRHPYRVGIDSPDRRRNGWLRRWHRKPAERRPHACAGHLLRPPARLRCDRYARARRSRDRGCAARGPWRRSPHWTRGDDPSGRCGRAARLR